MIVLQPILFFILAKVLVYYFKSPKDKPVNRNMKPEVFERQIEYSDPTGRSIYFVLTSHWSKDILRPTFQEAFASEN